MDILPHPLLRTFISRVLWGRGLNVDAQEISLEQFSGLTNRTLDYCESELSKDNPLLDFYFVAEPPEHINVALDYVIRLVEREVRNDAESDPLRYKRQTDTEPD